MKKTVAMILLFGFLLFLGACSGSQEMSREEVPTINNGNPCVVLHTSSKNYQLHNYVFTPDSLNGYLSPYRKRDGTFLTYYTYVAIPKKVNKRNHPYFSVHLRDIYKTELREADSAGSDIVFFIIEFLAFCWL